MKASESSKLNLFAAGLAYLLFSWSSSLWQAPANYRLAGLPVNLSLPAGAYDYVQDPGSMGGAEFGATSEGPVAKQSNILASDLEAVLGARRLMPNSVTMPQEWQFQVGQAWRQKDEDWADYRIAQPENEKVSPAAVAVLNENPSRLTNETLLAFYRPNAKEGEPAVAGESETDKSPLINDHPYTVASAGVLSKGSGDPLMQVQMLSFPQGQHDGRASDPVPEPASLAVLGIGSAYLLRKLRKR